MSLNKLLANKLKLNEDKTEFMVVTSKFYQATYQQIQPVLTIGGEVVKAAPSSPWNLGVVMDATMTMQGQTRNVKRSMFFFHLQGIGKIRRILDHDTCIMAVLTLVVSSLDYVNSLLAGQSQHYVDYRWHRTVQLV